MPFEHRITDVAGLRTHYAEPHPNVKAKAIDHIDGGARDFLALATFVVVATQGPRGGDASPRGGPPGFAVALDDERLAFGDLAGNRRLDTYENIVANPQVGLLFVIPGMAETLRVNGRACLTTDPAVLDACRCDGVDPEVAVGVEVAEVYLHCAKAFRRSGLWDPSTWPAAERRPRPSAIWRDHLNMGDVPLDPVDEELERGYAASMWQPGGADF
jgi:PPOX class probable FMN-dependent enzyme